MQLQWNNKNQKYFAMVLRICVFKGFNFFSDKIVYLNDEILKPGSLDCVINYIDLKKNCSSIFEHSNGS